MIHARHFAFLMLVTSTALSAQGPVSEDVVFRHRHQKLLFIRTDSGATKEGIPQPCIRVRVVVNGTGSVVSAKGESDVPVDMLTKAENAVRSMSYEPFQTGGHAVTTEFEECVLVLPAELQPSGKVPFPSVRDWSQRACA